MDLVSEIIKNKDYLQTLSVVIQTLTPFVFGFYATVQFISNKKLNDALTTTTIFLTYSNNKINIFNYGKINIYLKGIHFEEFSKPIFYDKSDIALIVPSTSHCLFINYDRKLLDETTNEKITTSTFLKLYIEDQIKSRYIVNCSINTEYKDREVSDVKIRVNEILKKKW